MSPAIIYQQKDKLILNLSTFAVVYSESSKQMYKMRLQLGTCRANVTPCASFPVKELRKSSNRMGEFGFTPFKHV